MKRCQKAQLEPECLVHFRKSYPTGTWEGFRSDNPTGYQEIREATRNDQGGLCAYCEMRLGTENEQIAHFHPKADTASDINWALNWRNLWLACKGGSQTWMSEPSHYLPPLPENLSCDEYKGSKILDGLVLAPSDIPAFPRIFRYEQSSDEITICVDKTACLDCGIDVEIAEKTIKEFNLNCARLTKARLAVYRQIEAAIKRLRESHVDPEQGFAQLARVHLSRDTGCYRTAFFSLIRWRLGKVAENYLDSVGYSG